MHAIFYRQDHAKRITKKAVLFCLPVLLVGSMLFYPWLTDDSHRRERSFYGNVDVLQANYERWKSKLRAQGDDGKLALSLAPIRGLSKKFLQARGKLSSIYLTAA